MMTWRRFGRCRSRGDSEIGHGATTISRSMFSSREKKNEQTAGGWVDGSVVPVSGRMLLRGCMRIRLIFHDSIDLSTVIATGRRPLASDEEA